MPSFSGKKNQKDRVRTEGGVAIWGKSEFQAEIINSSFVTRWHYMPSFSGKKCRMIK